MRTSFHHQPEAQHPKFFSYPQAAGRLPHLWGGKRTSLARYEYFRFRPKADEQTKALLKAHHSEIAGHAQEKLPLL
jgi:hypothetical protein